MTIEYMEDEILKEERETKEAFVGYFSKEGDLISFNIKDGVNGHLEWKNPISRTYLSYLIYVVGKDKQIKYGVGNSNTMTYQEFLDKLNKEINNYKDFNNPTLKFSYQILLFFRDLYKTKLDRRIEVLDFFEYLKLNKELESKDISYQRKYYLNNYLKLELMNYFKDIAVMYLGYDSIERVNKNGFIKDLGVEVPRIITSSYQNIYERYYNYLLMDWTVTRLPRYLYNENANKFEETPNLYESEKEEMLNDEIKAIKRLVPIKKREKYFR